MVGPRVVAHGTATALGPVLVGAGGADPLLAVLGGVDPVAVVPLLARVSGGGLWGRGGGWLRLT